MRSEKWQTDLRRDNDFMDFFFTPYFLELCHKGQYEVVHDIERQKQGIDVIIDDRKIDNKFSVSFATNNRHFPTFMYEVHQGYREGWLLQDNKTDEYWLMTASEWCGPVDGNGNAIVTDDDTGIRFTSKINEIFVMVEEKKAVQQYMRNFFRTEYDEDWQTILNLLGKHVFDTGKTIFFNHGVKLVKCYSTKEQAAVLVVPFREHLKIQKQMFYINRRKGVYDAKF